MDFVVVGLGLGAFALLGGVCLFGWAGRWERRAASATTHQDAAHDAAMAAWRRGAGQALLGAGSAVLLATIGALAGSLTDQTGAFLVTTTATVAGLGLLLWAYLYRSRHPVPPRAARFSAAANATVVPASEPLRPVRPSPPAPMVGPALPESMTYAAGSVSSPPVEPASDPTSSIESGSDIASDHAPEQAANERKPVQGPDPDAVSDPGPEQEHVPEAVADEAATEASEPARPDASPSPGLADLVAYAVGPDIPRKPLDDESDDAS